MDNVDGPFFAMSGSDQVDIPAVSITKEDGERLKSFLPTSNSKLAVENPGLIIRDASFDSGVIVHEYCHGLSTRLTGGPSNQVSKSYHMHVRYLVNVCATFILTS
jgi:hypothetical protein